MLPPGIFAWISGHGEGVAPTTPQALAGAHPSWAADMAARGPWDDELELDGFGRFAVAGGARPARPIVVAGECFSTMEAARQLAEAGHIGPWDAVMAVRQRGGRGQLRRPWVSSPGNLHVSLIMPQPPAEGPWREAAGHLLPLIAGYVFARVLDSLGADIRIKWPNDLLQADRKVGGILIEERKGLVVLGLGLNVVECPADGLMREDRSVPAGVLKIPHHAGGALALCEVLVNRGENVYASLFDEMEPSRFLPTVANRLAWYGRRVRVQEGGQEHYQAEITGLSPDGGLVLRRSGRDVVLSSGSIFPL